MFTISFGRPMKIIKMSYGKLITRNSNSFTPPLKHFLLFELIEHLHVCAIFVKVQLRVFYTALSYEIVVETEAYPLEEMVNELAGIFGLYFGFSVTSIVPMFCLAMHNLRRMTHRRTSLGVIESVIKYVLKPLVLKSFVLLDQYIRTNVTCSCYR